MKKKISFIYTYFIHRINMKLGLLTFCIFCLIRYFLIIVLYNRDYIELKLLLFSFYRFINILF